MEITIILHQTLDMEAEEILVMDQGITMIRVEVNPVDTVDTTEAVETDTTEIKVIHIIATIEAEEAEIMIVIETVVIMVADSLTGVIEALMAIEGRTTTVEDAVAEEIATKGVMLLLSDMACVS